MHTSFSLLDWGVFGLYFAILALSSYIFSRKSIDSTREYFTAKNSMGMVVVAVSMVATTQSAATFLGVPQFAYLHDFTLIGFYFVAFIAVYFIARFLVPQFFAMHAVSVYELLEVRYGSRAKYGAGVMFLVGRIMASGARLYIAAIAVSMILFLDISFVHIVLSSLLLLGGALLYTYFGGVRAVILSDVIQAVTYILAGIVVAYTLYSSLGDLAIYDLLEAKGKLRFIDTGFDGKFSLPALLSGWLLLNIAAYGLDQDMAQRTLSCKNKNEAAHSLFLSIALTIPVVLLFLTIGALLYLHYHEGVASHQFAGEKITVFMYYILNELPDGVRGFVTVGAIAAALSSTNSVLGAMASVFVEDIFKPYHLARGRDKSETYYLHLSRVSVVAFGFALLAMALLSYVWQHTFSLSLISFALGVMVFAYAPLLGIYFSALFTSRGSERGALVTLVVGFLSVLALQPYTFGLEIGFAYQLLIATLISFIVMQGFKTCR